MTRIHWTLVISLFVVIDQISKWMVETMLPLEQSVDMLPFISLYRTYNFGVAFSWLADLGRWPLVAMTIVIILFVLWLWRSLEDGRNLSAFGYACVMAGAIGNLIDRVWLGKVIDMILFHIDSLNFQFAVFNLADTFITIGAMAIVLDEILIWCAGKNPHLPEKEEDKEIQDG